MKIALILSYVFIAGLGIISFMQWRAIQKLTPQAPATPANNTQQSSDAPKSFGDMIDAVKAGAKQLKIEANF